MEVQKGTSITELIERLIALANENKNLRATLEAAQKLVEHQRSMEEVIGQALQEAMVVGPQAEAQAPRPAEARIKEEFRREKEEQEEVRAQAEVPQELATQDAKALRGQLERLDSSIQTALSVLQEIQNSMAKLESELATVAERLMKLSQEPKLAEPLEPRAPIPMPPKLTPEPKEESKAPIELLKEKAAEPPAPPSPEEKAEPASTQTTTLVVLGFQDISALRTFERAIAQWPDVVRLEPRRFSRGTLELTVEHRGELSPESFQVPGFSLVPSRRAKGYLEFRLVPASPEASREA